MRMFKPESEYSYSAHNYRSSPWLQIYDARHMEIDTTQYQTNRTYYSKLYKSMKTAGIQHQDILSIWGNPYIGTVTKWNELSYQRKQSLKLQYPEMEKLAESIEEQRRDFYDIFRHNICAPAKRFLDEYGFAISAIASTNPYGRAAVGLVRTGQAIVNVVPKLGKLITTIGSVELARQFQNLYKKTSGDGLKKAGDESVKPRVQNTQEAQANFVKRQQNSGVWQKSFKRVGGRETWYDKIKNLYYTKDTRHYDIEVWKVTGKKAYHQGSMEVYGGTIYKKPNHPPQTAC